MKMIKFFLSLILFLFLISCQFSSTLTGDLIEQKTTEKESTSTDAPINNSTVPDSIAKTSPSNALPNPLNTPEIQLTEAFSDCSQGWTKLKAGIYAKVAGTETDLPNRVRSGPAKSDTVIAQIYPGTIVEVVDGPICDGNLVFWQVKNKSIPGGVGWTAEGDGIEVWLEPYAYIPESIQLTAYGVNLSVPGNWAGVPEAKIIGSGQDSHFELCKWPEHIKITLTSYPVKSDWNPIIYVFVTEKQPDWYPICPGAPLLRVRQQTLKQGDRLLYHSTNAQPITNEGLIYSYQGTTSDGVYTIIVFFPINHLLLADSWDIRDLPAGGIPFDMETSDWEPYYQQVSKQLETAADTDFTPSLSLLDAIVVSITVTKP